MKKAFTLIELLVVIAIIAILAAILFPVFAQAKLAAKKTSALSNNKQLALGSIMYCGDSDDVFSYGTTGPGPNNNSPSTTWRWQDNWIMNSVPYIKSFELFRDSNDPHKPSAPYDSGPGFSFVGNGLMCYDWQSANAWVTQGIFAHNSQLYRNDTTSATSVALPADTILVAERYKLLTPDPNNGGDNPTGVYSPNNVVVTAGYAPKQLPGQMTAAGADCPSGKPCVGGKYEIVNNFSGQGTFSFVDGHAKAMKPEQTVDYNAYSSINCDAMAYKLWNKTRTQ